MQIFIAKGSEQSGPFTLQQIHEQLNQGELTLDDHYFHEGLSDWTPLSEVIAVQPEPAAPSSKAVSQTASAGPSLSAPSASQPKSNVPVVIAIIAVLMVLGGLAAAGGWFFFLRDNEEPTKIVEAIENEEEEPSPKTGITFPAPSTPSPAKPVLPGGPPEPQTNPETKKPDSLTPKQVADLFAEDIGKWKIEGKAMPVGGDPESFEDTMEIRWKEEGKSTTATFSAVINGKEVRFIGHKEYRAKEGVFIYRNKGEGLPYSRRKSRRRNNPKSRNLKKIGIKSLTAESNRMVK